MRDVLFITPPTPKPTSWKVFRDLSEIPQLGIGYMMAILENNGFSADEYNYYLGIKDLDAFKNTIKSESPKIVGLACSTETYQNAILLSGIIKEIDTDIIVVMGGPHVTFTAEETLKLASIDVAVKREGEFTMLDLANYYIRHEGRLEDIKGIVYKNGDAIVTNRNRPFIKDLDSLPLPKRKKIGKRVGLISSRGCPNKCIFCAAGALSGGKYRMRSAENVFDEILYFYKKDIRKFSFYDDTVTVDIDRLSKLCRLMANLSGITWTAESRVDVITEDPDIFNKMAKAGCGSVQLGIESGSQETLDKMKKGIRLEQTENAIASARKAGLEVVCSMIFGLPFDTRETIRTNVDFGLYLQSKYQAGVLISHATPFPGTYLYKYPEKQGINITTYDYNEYSFGNPIIDGKYLTVDEKRTMYFDELLKIITNQPKCWQDSFRNLEKI